MAEVTIIRKHHWFIQNYFFINFKENGLLFDLTGAASKINKTMNADNKANTELQTITNFQLTEEKNIITKWGNEDPNVSAAIKIPIANPRFLGNHSDKIFTAVGYTPARVIPVNTLSKIPKPPKVTRINKAFNMAPSNAEIAKIFRGLKRSAIPRNELHNAHMTKPIGTEAESQASELELRFQIPISSGAITEALNHRPKAHNSDKPIHPNALQEP
ncbi:hypothetical protein [Sporosarcina sp. FSL W7-1349]|uniref:hypothetical protein n=1 Tax=Sporosarcina sp. FSL W7-1349 TaxID=2921561 RepID=UPI004046D17B